MSQVKINSDGDFKNIISRDAGLCNQKPYFIFQKLLCFRTIHSDSLNVKCMKSSISGQSELFQDKKCMVDWMK